jgi:hypothetical protein
MRAPWDEAAALQRKLRDKVLHLANGGVDGFARMLRSFSPVE